MAKRAPGPPAPQGPQTQANSSVAVDAPANSGRAPFMGGDGYGDGGGGDGEGGDTIITEYLKEHFAYIRDIIFQHIHYPEAAKQKGLEGKVLVAFVIMEDGNVKDIKIMTSSGSELLDKSAVETIKTSAPFPKPPSMRSCAYLLIM